MPRVQLLNGPDAALGMAGERTVGQAHEGTVTQIARVVTADTDLLLPDFDAMPTTGAAPTLPGSLR